jgi:hypothetical protein
VSADDREDELELTGALRELGRRAPAGPDGARVHRVLRLRKRRRVAIFGGMALAGVVAVMGVTMRFHAPMPEGAAAPEARDFSPGGDERAFRVVSVGEFSPRAEAAVRMPGSGMCPTMPAWGVEVPRVSISFRGFGP